MARYENPELLEVGTVDSVVLGTKNSPADDMGDSPSISLAQLSVLDVD